MDPLSRERRRGDRRAGDRRRSGRRREDGFASTDVGADGAASVPDSFFDPGWLSAGDVPRDSGFRHHQARRLARAQAPGGALARVVRTYAAARAVVGMGLVAAQGVGSLLGARGSEWLALVSTAYAVQAVTLWLLPRFGRWMAQPSASAAQRRRRWAATIGADLLAFALLHAADGGTAFNFAALLVLPVLMAGVLTSRLAALATASATALVLLAVAWRGAALHDLPAAMMQAGLLGLGLFVITLLAGELAARLVREEGAARGSLELVRQQAQLNRLVIEEMADGVMVVDQRLRVRAANPAARALLVEEGLCPPSPFALHDRAAWARLAQAVEQALAEGQWPEGGRDVALALAPGYTRTLRLRVRFMRGSRLGGGVPQDDGAAAAGDAAGLSSPGEGEPAPERLVVLLMEDVRTLQARIRQEQLAAMGRVSAGIAHEIRNPLSAVAQANALMMEDALAPTQQRLARIVADNVARLKRLVDDVMEVAPGGPVGEHALDARAALAEIAADWARTNGVAFGGPQARLRLELGAAALPVTFDPEHLRRVLVNLLDNAHRHAAPSPGAVALRLAVRDAQHAEVAVVSRGPRIAADVEPYLFEPFFSTRSRGTGLGLYICRELCERHGGGIEYLPLGPDPAGGGDGGPDAPANAFIVTLRRAPAAAAPDPAAAAATASSSAPHLPVLPR